jgi:Xaa-Pro dipeptidase
VLERYWDVGGVRIEGEFFLKEARGREANDADNILITEDGYENLTTAVKEVEDMERIINEQ